MTVKEMSKYQFTDKSLKEGYHLSDVLMTSTLISGNGELWKEYDKEVHKILTSKSSTNENITVGQERGLETLRKDIKKYLKHPLSSKSFTKKMHTKHDIYRFATITINVLKLMHGCTSSAPLDVLEELREKKILTERAKTDLQIMVCTVINLRHMVYGSYKQQKELISFLESDNLNGEPKEVMPVRSFTAIIRFYITFLPWCRFLQSNMTVKGSWLYLDRYIEESHEVKGEFYKNIYIYKYALTAYKAELESLLESKGHERQILKIKNVIGSLYESQGKCKEALEYYKDILIMCEKNEDKSGIALSLNNIGNMHKNLGNHYEALIHLHESLNIYNKIHYRDIARSLNNLGNMYYTLGDQCEALKYHQDSLDMRRKIYRNNEQQHPDIASSLNNIGNVYKKLRELHKALEYHKESLDMRRMIYKDIKRQPNNPRKPLLDQDSSHPEIANSLCNLGNVHAKMGDYEKALDYNKKSLAMRVQIYQDSSHQKETENDGSEEAVKLSRELFISTDSMHRRESQASCQSNMSLVNEKSPRGELTSSSDTINSINFRNEDVKTKRVTPHPDVASSLYSIGKVYGKMRWHTKAMQFHEVSLDMKRSIHENDLNTDIASSLYRIGDLYCEIGDQKSALEHHQQSLAIRKQIYKDHPHLDVARSLYSIGYVYCEMEDLSEALEHHTQCLLMRKKIHSDKPHHDTSNSLYQIARVYSMSEDNDKALDKHKDCMAMRKQIHKDSPQHADIAQSLYMIGLVYERMGKDTEKYGYHQESLEMTKEINRSSEMPNPNALHKIGYLYAHMGYNTEALTNFQKSLEIRPSKIDPDAARTMFNIGRVYRKMGEKTKALKYHQDSLQIRREIYQQSSHQDVSSSLYNIGIIYSEMGENTKALDSFQESVKIRKQLNQEQNLFVSTLYYMGIVHDKMGEHTKAKDYHRQVLEIYKEIHQDCPHPNIARSLYKLGNTYDDLEQAVKYHQDGLAMYKKIHKDRPHQDVTRSLRSLGKVEENKGDYKQALNYYHESLDMALQYGSDCHSDYQEALKLIDQCNKKTNKIKMQNDSIAPKFGRLKDRILRKQM
ncbi:unnamed protein product [Owenia fusiformis]|uniref:Anaphase-promoting complex subunit 5 domain-containing protein n=1 Tax=Owenia fusiformis TaxID=6347 RepID=A0A8S4Q4F4_OWEFU|nr:unnamed protein product [Owenia fusiformis]